MLGVMLRKLFLIVYYLEKINVDNLILIAFQILFPIVQPAKLEDFLVYHVRMVIL